MSAVRAVLSRAAERGPGGRRPARDHALRAATTVGVLAAAVLGFLCYHRLSWTVAASSDGAANALQARDMLQGNWLLRGWLVSDVSFYTTELPEYMLVELTRTLGPDVIHVSGAITYTLLVLTAGLLARGRARGGDGLARGPGEPDGDRRPGTGVVRGRPGARPGSRGRRLRLRLLAVLGPARRRGPDRRRADGGDRGQPGGLPAQHRTGNRAPVPPSQELAGWLVAHHLSYGLAGPEANITTVDSGGQVQLAMVIADGPSRVRPFWYQMKASWYDPRLHYADFLVTEIPGGNFDTVPPRVADRTFGPPAAVYHFLSGYTVMVWHRNLLARVEPLQRTLP